MTATEKNAAISRMILEKVAAGMTVREAFDAVLGAGRFDDLAGELYETIRTNA